MDLFVYFCSAFLCVEGSSCCCEVGCSQWRQLYLPKGIGRTDCCCARDGHRFIFGGGSRFGTTSTLHSFLIPSQDWPQTPFSGGSPPGCACSVRRSVIPATAARGPRAGPLRAACRCLGLACPAVPSQPLVPRRWVGGWHGARLPRLPGLCHPSASRGRRAIRNVTCAWRPAAPPGAGPAPATYAHLTAGLDSSLRHRLRYDNHVEILLLIIKCLTASVTEIKKI